MSSESVSRTKRHLFLSRSWIKLSEGVRINYIANEAVMSHSHDLVTQRKRKLNLGLVFEDRSGNMCGVDPHLVLINFRQLEREQFMVEAIVPPRNYLSLDPVLVLA